MKYCVCRKRIINCLIIILSLAMCFFSCKSEDNKMSIINEKVIVQGIDWHITDNRILYVSTDLGMHDVSQFLYDNDGFEVTNIVLEKGVYSLTRQNASWIFLLNNPCINLSSSVSKIDGLILSSCNTVNLDENPYYRQENGLIIEEETQTLIYCDRTKKRIIIPNGVKKVDMAFYNHDTLETVFFPDSVQQIGEMCFSGCSQLQVVRLPENRGLQIDEWAFPSSCGLRCITLPTHVYLNAGLAEDSGMFGSTIQTIIVSGEDINIEAKDFCRAKGLKQIIFLGAKPSVFDENAFDMICPDLVIYYLKEFSYSWSPNGEDSIGNHKLIPVDSIESINK